MIDSYWECNYCKYFKNLKGKDCCTFKYPWISYITNETLREQKGVCENCTFSDELNEFIKQITKMGLTPKNR